MIIRDGNRNEHKQTLLLGTTTLTGTVEGSTNKGRGVYVVNTRLFTIGALLRLQGGLARQSTLPYVFADEIYARPQTSNPGHGSIPRYGYSSNVVINNPLYSNARLKDYFRMDITYSMERMLKKCGSRVWQISILNVTMRKIPYLSLCG